MLQILIILALLGSPCFAADKKPEAKPPTLQETIQQQREACGKELAEVLKKHGFTIKVAPEILINGQPAQVILVPIQ